MSLCAGPSCAGRSPPRPPPGLVLLLLLSLLALLQSPASGRQASSPGHTPPVAPMDRAPVVSSADPPELQFPRAPVPLFGGVSFHTVNTLLAKETSIAIIGQAADSAQLFSQALVDFTTAPEWRAGCYFSEAHPIDSISSPFALSLGTTRFVPSLFQPKPALLEVSENVMRLVLADSDSTSHEHTTPTRALAMVADSPEKVFAIMMSSSDVPSLLVLARDAPPTSFGLQLSHFTYAGVRGVRGSQHAIFLWQGNHIARVTFDNPASPAARYLALPYTIISLEAVRIHPNTNGSMDDLLVLYGNGEWALCTQCHGLTAQTDFRVIHKHPAPVRGRILAVAGYQTDTPVNRAFFHETLTPSGDALWRMDFDADAQLLGMRPVALAANALANAPTLQVMQLRRSSQAWTIALADRSYVYFDGSDFGCGPSGDETIVCSPSSPDGWACKTGHAQSLFGTRGRLCDACSPGWGAEYLPTGVECTKCPDPNCAVCNLQHGCLACLEGFRTILQRDGQVSCIGDPACPEGTIDDGVLCLASEATSHLGVYLRLAESPVRGLAPGEEVGTLVPTSLEVDPATGTLLLPGPGPVVPVGSRGMLSLRAGGSPVYLRDDRPTAALDAIPLGELGPLANLDVRSAMELRVWPASQARPFVALLVCHTGGLVLFHTQCPAGWSQPQDPCPVELRSEPIPGGCEHIARLEAHAASVLRAPGNGALHIRLDMVTGKLLPYPPQSHAIHHLALLETPNVGLGPGDRLVVAPIAGGKLRAAPEAMLLREEARMQALTMAGGSLLHPGLSLPAGWHPVVVRTPHRAASPGELFVTGLIASADGSNRVFWEALHLSQGVLPVGARAHALPARRQRLATLAGGHPPAFQVQAIPLQVPGVPGALVAMTPSGIHVAPVYCHPVTDLCAARPAVGQPFASFLPRHPAGHLLAPRASSLVGATGRAFMLSGHEAGPPAQLTIDIVSCAGPGQQPPHCLECHESCLGCEEAGREDACLGCPAGRVLFQRTCLDGCPAGMWPDAGVCRACAVGCAACTGPGSCSGCLQGEFLSPTTRRCLSCQGSCAECDDDAACTVCKPGMVFLSPDAQTRSLCGSTCPPGQHVGAARCEECSAPCSLCAGPGPDACLVCAPGFRWLGPPPPQPQPDTGGTCVACAEGCHACTDARCLACAAGLLLTDGGACVAACPAGFFSNGESCQPCDVSCRTCAGGAADQCTDCGAGLELVEAAPGVGTCVSGCPEGQYPAGGACLPCDAACATCNGPTDKDCWRCTGAILQDTECVQACAAGHFAAGDRCLACHASCEACTGSRSTDCTACPAGLLPLPAGQSPMRCVPACPVGSRLTAAGCAPCGARCASCPGEASTCGQCERGWLLDGPACVASCPAGSWPLGVACSGCHAACASCHGPGAGDCRSCAAPAPLQLDSTCHGACPAGTFQSDHMCLPCSGMCAGCSGPSSTECTGCRPQGFLLQGACLDFCPGGHFADGQAACQACHASCAMCTGPLATECTGCHEPGLLHAGRCVDQCPPGRVACRATGQCDPCPEGCTSCQPGGPVPGHMCSARCTACQAGLVLFQDRCVEACPAGEFHADSRATLCQPCSDVCASCFGAADMCTACADAGLWLQWDTGVCLGACPPGQAPTTSGHVCLHCMQGCARCTAGPAADACTTAPDRSLACLAAGSCDECAPGLLLLGRDKCVAACPEEGFFADWAAAPAACRPCDPRCRACVGPTGADCASGDNPARRRLALGLGIGCGLLLLLLLAVLVFFLLRRLLRQRRASAKEHDDEDATVMNTMLELSLPGSILVSIASDFAPLDEQLGAGTQASVFAARAVGAGISDRLGCPGTVAIKQLKAARMTPAQVTLFQNEVALMWLLRDAPNIVRLYGYSEQPPAIVMERFDTDLASLLHSDVPLDQGTILDICQQWASGLEAMHTQGIAHRDLKPGNVFASQRPDGSWTAALGDLGTSRNLNTDRSSTLVSQAPELNAMTARYAAPEVLAAFQRRRPLAPELLLPADIYSAAVMLWECLTRMVPWAGMNFEHIMLDVVAGKRPAVPPDAPLGDLLRMGWDSSPHSRPLAASLRQKCAHAWTSQQ
ncbi:TKL protein kinase [Fonticula alba]|uniref:TKL protein kinase n=1 Tax=Fonticula alba TaxID=691883 RepID=A0A058Z1J7_FONAL|nr:TKL protein kinase [Fonticula alba]KCV68135.1 TKL protein kinase [Fonticula alba]|eukprot:XP_009497509.1 TKL protein kinase [Fonticula alba]